MDLCRIVLIVTRKAERTRQERKNNAHCANRAPCRERWRVNAAIGQFIFHWRVVLAVPTSTKAFHTGGYPHPPVRSEPTAIKRKRSPGRRSVGAIEFGPRRQDVRCVLATIMGAVDHGYRVILVRDGVCSSSDEGHDALLELYHRRFSIQIETADAEAVLSRWA
jgi:Isochorismatase family